MVPQNCSVSHILQSIFFCGKQNKDIHTGLELLHTGLYPYQCRKQTYALVSVYYCVRECMCVPVCGFNKMLPGGIDDSAGMII